MKHKLSLGHLIYSFYKRNYNNLIGKTMRGIKYSAISPKKKKTGTKGDLKYIKAGRGIFNKTKRVAIELSNICNYAPIHKNCPLNRAKKHKILSEKIVYHILKTCQKYNFKGYIAFDVYNEPCIDPRLMMFIKKTKEMLPKAKVILQTNGFYFDQTLAEEFEKNGVYIIRVSAYTPKDYERLSRIKLKNTKFIVTFIVLDDRLKLYSSPKINYNRPCYAPLNEIIITNEGKVSLCCMDWKRKYIFGDLNKQGLEEILQSKKIQETYNKLSKGNRFLDICKRCKNSR